MKTPLEDDEVAVTDGPASMQRGIETVGGWLYLTNQRLIFESHKLNVKYGYTILPLTSITSAKKCWTKFLNLVPLFPNGMAVSTSDGKEHRFILFGRQAWIDSIEGERLLLEEDDPEAP